MYVCPLCELFLVSAQTRRKLTALQPWARGHTAGTLASRCHHVRCRRQTEPKNVTHTRPLRASLSRRVRLTRSSPAPGALFLPGTEGDRVTLPLELAAVPISAGGWDWCQGKANEEAGEDPELSPGWEAALTRSPQDIEDPTGQSLNG